MKAASDAALLNRGVLVDGTEGAADFCLWHRERLFLNVILPPLFAPVLPDHVTYHRHAGCEGNEQAAPETDDGDHVWFLSSRSALPTQIERINQQELRRTKRRQIFSW